MILPDNPTISLIDATPLWLTKGIFHALVSPPWAALHIDVDVLETDYYLANSGKKPIAPIVHNFLDEDAHITDAGIAMLGKIIMAKFYEPWTHLLATYHIDYSPIVNYNITEHHAYEESGDHSSSDETTYGKTITTDDTTSRTETVNDTEGVTKNEVATQRDDADRYGYNSTSGVPTDRYNTVLNRDNTDNKQSTSSRTGSDDRDTSVVSSGKDTVSGTKEDSTEGTRDITRSGINGIISVQKLIEDDRKLWLTNFFDQVYRDIDSVMTLPIYSSKRRLQPWVLYAGRNA